VLVRAGCCFGNDLQRPRGPSGQGGVARIGSAAAPQSTAGPSVRAAMTSRPGAGARPGAQARPGAPARLLRARPASPRPSQRFRQVGHRSVSCRQCVRRSGRAGTPRG